MQDSLPAELVSASRGVEEVENPQLFPGGALQSLLQRTLGEDAPNTEVVYEIVHILASIRVTKETEKDVEFLPESALRVSTIEKRRKRRMVLMPVSPMITLISKASPVTH